MSLFTVPPEKPFLRVLASHLLKAYGANPLSLSSVLVLLPSRRACRALRDTFLDLSEGCALLLPRIEPVGDIDEDGLFTAAAPDAELPPAMPKLQRHLLLTRLVAAFTRESPEDAPRLVQAATLAAELAVLFDEIEREELSLAALPALVPAEFAAHWQLTLRFLDILSRQWPKVLQESGMEDPVRRRSLLINAQAEEWRMHPPTYPVIAAGIYAAMPSTARLLKVIAGLPEGMLVLPGLDCDMPDAEWDALDETHPQHPLKSLLAVLNTPRGHVQALDTVIEDTCNPARIQLLRTAFTPAECTARWRECKMDVASAMKGLQRIDCPTPHQEALVIAAMLREVLETPAKTAAVVTHDRTLARMVTAACERFGIVVDDSAGRALKNTPTGVFLRLIAEMAQSRASPVPLLALLKHPLAAAGMSPPACREAARALELAALRGARHTPGLEILRDALQNAEDTPPAALALVEALLKGGEAFMACFRQEHVSFAAMLKAHLAFAESLAESNDESAAKRLWHGEQGEALAEFVSELFTHAATLDDIDPAAYPALFESLLAQQVYRPRFGAHPRLHILSPLEARFEQADTVIMAGCNEGSWPPITPASPWMSRPMQRAFGLPVPERAVGFAAQDFMMISHARKLIFTRSEKAAGTPTEPSRWLLKLSTLLSGLTGSAFAWPETPYPTWVSALQAPLPLPPFLPPAPLPPVSARPRRLSVTMIETWQRDPYAIYARHILGLKALDPLDQDPDAADFGSLIHAALERFVKAYPAALPEDAFERLLAFGSETFAPLLDRPAVSGFWWPRFRSMARWFIAEEMRRRQEIKHLAAELTGTLVIAAPAGDFTLTTRIDRAEIDHANRLRVIDYKTGGVPSNAEIHDGTACQLPLEALIAEKGALTPPLGGVEGLSALEYWKLAGEGSEIIPVGVKKGASLAALRAEAEAGVSALVRAFDDAETPYLACPDPARAPRYNDYAHLERMQEWGGVDAAS